MTENPELLDQAAAADPALASAPVADSAFAPAPAVMPEAATSSPEPANEAVRPTDDPRIGWRAELSSLRDRALNAKRRLMVDELADIVAETHAFIAKLLG